MSAYLSATSSSSNRKTWTWSGWTKKSRADGSYNALFTAGSQNFILRFGDNTNDRIVIYDFNGASTVYYFATDAIFRDVSAWYHVVLTYDTTQATSSDRLKCYVNGVLQSAVSGSTYPSLNYDGYINSGLTHYVGHDAALSNRDFLGVMAHVHFIDGTAYDASAFGETDSASGIWKPKTSPSVTYGTNGFFLNFANSSDLGNDVSGNNNDFTMSGTGTQTLDTPSNVFATGNTLIDFSGTQVNYVNATHGNTTITANSTMPTTLMVSTDTTNKWYYEYKVTALSTSDNGTSHGWSTEKNIRMGSNTWAASNTLWLYATNGDVFNGSWAGAGTAPTYTTGDIIGCALDLENSTVKWYKNGTLAYTFSSVTFDGDLIFPCLQCVTTGSTVSANFGNGYFGTTAVATPESDSAGLGKFEYSVPTGYYALCTKNIADYG